MDKKSYQAATLAVQAGYNPGNGDPRITPLVQSTTFRYSDAQSVAELFDLKREGYFYTRLANPTVAVLEEKVAALEHGVGAVAVSSGQTANTLAILNIAGAGDHIVAASALYGGTVNLFTVTLPKMGLKFTLVPPDASEAEIAAAVRPNTKAIFAETIANPALNVVDFDKFVRVAKRYLAEYETDSPLAGMARCEAKDVFDFAKAGDTTAKAILEIVYSYLGQLIANVCNVLNPEAVILGGGVSKAGQCLIDGVVPYFMKDAFPGVKKVKFALAKLGNDAGAYGAFKLLLD